jgi:hypothetical protein
MKKNSLYLAVRVKGQKNINDQTNAFATQLSSTKVSRGWEFNQSGFEGLGVQPINF